MKKIKKIFYYLKERPSYLLFIVWEKFAYVVSDEIFLKVAFRLKVGYWPDFEVPKSYNEKLQWLKMHYIRPEYTQMVDKIEVKKYVGSIIGDKYIIPTIGTFDDLSDINWNSLPNQFVIKAAHDSGGVVVCRDKRKLNILEAENRLINSGKRDYTKFNKEYPYHNVAHRYIVEKYMEDESGTGLIDYKIFCFDGSPKYLFVATGRQVGDTRFDFFDLNFNHIPVLNGHPNADKIPTKPKNFDEMLEIATKLSKGMPHVRVDLYNIDGNIYFGELTFFHWSGLMPYEPREWDYKFGEYLKLPKANKR